MAHSIAINITDGVSKEELQGFMDALPSVVKITPAVKVDKADRPYESDHTSVKLQAEWTT